MLKLRSLLTIPLLLTASLAGAAEIKDNAGMFSRDAVRKAEAALDRVASSSGVSVTIETIESLGGQSIDRVAPQRARRDARKGIFVLMSKEDHKIETLVSRGYEQAFPRDRRLLIRDAFREDFKSGDFDGGLMAGVRAIEGAVDAAKAEGGGTIRTADNERRAAPAPIIVPRAPARGGRSGFGVLLVIGLVILAVLIGLRLLGGLFAGPRYAGPGRMGPGYGAPGYGAPGYGYGGRGGGFFSGLLGGLGGAVAGNWLYDRFNRPHGGGADTGGVYGGDAGQQAPQGTDWVGTGESADWGGGGDTGGGGGDWGGGGGGGGDWGGGGGGGGDWGGGGGDWGGGGGDGGSW